MVRYCDQCGNELKEYALFCSKCGAKSDLPPEKTVEKKLNNLVNENTESVNDKVNDTVNGNTESDEENTNNNETILTKIDNLISNTNNGENDNGFDLNDIDWDIVLKYSVAGTIISLILGLIFFALFINTNSTPPTFGLTPYSFIFAVLLVVVILTAHIQDKLNALVVGFAIGLLTGIFQFSSISLFFRIPEFSLSIIFANPILVLIIVGVVFAYVSNVYLKDKINIPIITEILGE